MTLHNKNNTVTILEDNLRSLLTDLQNSELNLIIKSVVSKKRAAVENQSDHENTASANLPVNKEEFINDESTDRLPVFRISAQEEKISGLFSNLVAMKNETVQKFLTGKSNKLQVSVEGYGNALEIMLFKCKFDNEILTFALDESGIQCPEKTIAFIESMEIARLLSRFSTLEVKDKSELIVTGDFDSIGMQYKRFFFKNTLLGAMPSLALRFLQELDILKFILPEIADGAGLSQNKFHKYDIFEHSIRSCDGVLEPNFKLRCAALLHDIGKVPTRKTKENGESTFYNHEVVSAHMMVDVMKRFGIPKKIGISIKFLVRNHMFHYTSEWTDRAVRRFLKKVNSDELKNLIELRKADRIGSGKKVAFPKGLGDLISHIGDIIKEDSQLKVADLSINGIDLMNFGLPEGPAIGRILKIILEEVTAETIEKDRDTLLERSQALISKIVPSEKIV